MADRVGIIIDLQNGESALNTLRQIRQVMAEIRRAPVIHLNVAGAKQELNSFYTMLNNVKNTMDSLSRSSLNMGGGKQIDDALGKVNQLESRISSFEQKGINPQVDTSGIDRLVSGLEMAASIAGGISTVFSGMNSAIGGVGNAFSGMSNLFSIDLLNTSKRYLTAMATRMVTQNIGDIMNRYDILSTFTPYMQIAGVNAGTADAALQRVNQSILGLPIGLDEAAYRLRRYQMFVGDTEQATNLTIGLQNALTAGGASQSMKNTAYMEMERLLTSGDLATWRQWQALITGFGVSSRFIADAMSELSGKKIDVKELARGLHDGSVSADDLLRAIEYLGQDWSNVPDSMVPKFVKDMNSALDIYKGTLEAWVSNIKFAVTRGGANVLTSLNETMRAEEGMGIVDVMKGIRDTINEIFSGGSSFISSHPEGIAMFFDMAGKFMERARGFDWGLFSENVIGNIGRLANMAFSAFDAIPPGALEEFASFAITIAGPAGGLIKLMQSGFPQMLAVFKAFHDFNFEGFLDNTTKQLSIFTNVVGGALRLFNNDTMSGLASFALVWGKPLVSVLNGIGSAAGYVSKSVSALSTRSGYTALSYLLMFAASHSAELAMLGTATAGGLAGYGITYAATARMRAQAEREGEAIAAARAGASLIDIDTMENDVKELAKQPEVLSESWKSSLTEIDSKAKESKIIVDEILKLDEQINNAASSRERNAASEQLAANLERLKTISPDLELSIDASTGALDAESAAALADADAFIALAEAKAKSEGAASVIADAEANKITLTAQRSRLYPLYAAAVSDVERNRSALQRLLDNPEYAGSRQLFDTDEEATPQFTEEYTKRVAEASAALNVSEEQVEALGKDIGILNEGIADNEALMESASKVLTGYAEKQTKAWDDLNEAQQSAIDTYEEYLEKEREATTMGGFERIEDKGNISAGQTQSDLGWNNTRYGLYNEARQKIWDWYGSLSASDKAKAYPAFMEIMGLGPDDRDRVYGFADAVEGIKHYIPEAVDGIISEIDATINNEDTNDKMNAALKGLTPDNFSLMDVILGSGKDPTTTVQEAKVKAQETVNSTILPLVERAKEIFEGFTGSGGVEEISDSAQEVADTSAEATDALETMETAEDRVGSAAQRNQGKVSNFAGAVSAVRSQANTAADAVNRLAAAIASLHSKHIEITVAVQQLGSGLIAGAHNLWNSVQESIGLASGGWADDGRIIHGPTGTDTIRAWLSPGEFVVNARAAKKFGPTLEAINGMNIDGAFDALMHNLARPSGMYMPTVSYNRDNHAQVNINNYGETGQGYSQRKAYAWASKL